MNNHQENVVNRVSMRSIVSSFCLFILALTLGASKVSAQESPEGLWHFAVAGSERGVAILTFDGVGGISGVVMVVPPAPKFGVAPDFLYGSSEVTGTWQFDDRGRILANYDVGAEEDDYFVSLVGRVRNGRFTAIGNSVNGRINMRGLMPTGGLPDISGFWTGLGSKVVEEAATEEDRPRIDIFVDNMEFIPTATPGIYDVVGRGPYYDIEGQAALIEGNRFAMVVEMIPAGEGAEGTLRTLAGRFNPRSFGGSASGVEEETPGSDNFLRVNLRLRPGSGVGAVE